MKNTVDSRALAVGQATPGVDTATDVTDTDATLTRTRD
jgi:hypothetical protein